MILAALALFGVGTVAVVSGAADEPAPAPTTTTTAAASTTTATAPPRSDQLRFSGVVRTATIDGVIGEPVALPITLEPSERGGGNGAELTGVLVDGAPASIVWDGGVPFALDGDGLFAPDPTLFRIVDGTRFEVVLDQRVHGLLAGNYVVDTPVAVGADGVAAPRDRVDFVVEGEASIAIRGEVRLTLGTGAELLGPGSASLEGDFEYETADGTGFASSLSVAPGGLFEISVDVGDEFVIVEGLLQGDFTIDDPG